MLPTMSSIVRPLAQLEPDLPVARQIAGAGQHQVAHAGEHGEGHAGWPRGNVPSRAISLSPRVMSAARVLWPKPSPSAMPAPMA
jgi:hypothetical protein